MAKRGELRQRYREARKTNSAPSVWWSTHRLWNTIYMDAA